MFELHLARAPTDDATIARAEGAACIGLEACGWRVMGTVASPITHERFVHALR